MAFFPLSSVFIYFVLVSGFIRESAGNYEYRDEREAVPGLEFRSKRYVSEVIQRLADNYDKPMKNSKSVGKNRVEMIGSMSMPALEAETDQPIHSPSPSQPPPADHQNLTTLNVTAATTPATSATTAEPEKKPSKKPIDPAGKKQLDADKAIAKPDANTTEQPTDSIDDFPKDISNNTIAKHNLTQEKDHHIYYTSTFIGSQETAQHYWVDLEKEHGVVVNEMLSKSHRRAATLRLTFDFPFYGHRVRNMTVATGGFLYTGDYIHSWLAATQYIAPLMANFDTSMSDQSFVKYRDNGTSFTVEWSRVALQDTLGAGEFSFQATLHKSGDIVFVYKQVPIPVESIVDTLHPVKVGLSDAYIIDKTVFYIRKKTIYEYHRVSFDKDDIKNWTAIYIKPLPTCVSMKDCYSCLSGNTTFSCRWCDSIGHCSSGYDRFLQDWSENNCPDLAVSNVSECSSKSTRQAAASLAPHVQPHSKADDGEGSGHGGMFGMMVLICLAVCLAAWVYHAYRNPHTKLGQMLIKYRPSQWRLRRGEARYTAATIHM